MSGQGNYEHTAAPVGMTEWSPPAWSWFFGPGYEEPYDRIPGYGSGSLGVAAGSTHNYHGSVTESRKRDWGHQYDTETSLVDGEWVNTGSGHTFLKFKADSLTDRTVAQNITWSGSGSSGVNQVTGNITWSNSQRLTSSWHKEYDGKQDYVLAENATTGNNFWRKTTLTETYHANASGTSDYDFTSSWNLHHTRSTTADWEMFDNVHTGTLEAHRNESFSTHFDVNNKVTTFNSAGNVQSTTGTQTWDKTTGGTFTRTQDNEETYWRNWDSPESHLGTYNHFTQYATETSAYSGSWSKNLATNVPVTITSSGTTTGDHDAHLIHEEYVGHITEGSYLDYEAPFDHENTYSYANTGEWSALRGEHGFTPTDLGTLENSGSIPVSTNWFLGPQGVMEGYEHETPPATGSSGSGSGSGSSGSSGSGGSSSGSSTGITGEPPFNMSPTTSVDHLEGMNVSEFHDPYFGTMFTGMEGEEEEGEGEPGDPEEELTPEEINQLQQLHAEIAAALAQFDPQDIPEALVDQMIADGWATRLENPNDGDSEDGPPEVVVVTLPTGENSAVYINLVRNEIVFSPIDSYDPYSYRMVSTINSERHNIHSPWHAAYVGVFNAPNVALKEQIAAELTFALHLVPGGAAVDQLTNGDIQNGLISAAGDILMLLSGIAEVAGAAKAARALFVADVLMNGGIAVYRGKSAFDKFHNEDYIGASGDAAEVFLRLIGVTLGSRRLLLDKYRRVAATNVASRGVGKFDVGPYNQMKGRVPGLDVHHAGQSAAMKKVVKNYDHNTAPTILVPKVGHTIKGPNGIVSRNTKGLNTARDILARDIKELRRVYPDVPNSKLQELIKMNRDLYLEMLE